MDSDSADEIRKRMESVRKQMRDDVTLLVENARIKSDWRHYVQRYPWLALGAATLVGYWLVPKAARKVAFDPEMFKKLGLGQMAPPPNSGKSVLGLITGTVVPLLTRMAVSKIMERLVAAERPADPSTSEPAATTPYSRPYKPK